MLGATETIIIVLAIVFLFGGNKVLDWTKKFVQAKKEVKEVIK